MPDFGRWSANGGDPSLNEINRTDRFLDALANRAAGVLDGSRPRPSWRNCSPVGATSVRDAAADVAGDTPRRRCVALRRAVESRKRTRTSMAVVGSVAAAVLCLGGFGAVVAGAGPGDALYGLRTHAVRRADSAPATTRWRWPRSRWPRCSS